MIPTIDLAGAEVGADFVRGVATLGFVQLVNHGADLDAAAELLARSGEFFALEPPTKAQFVHPDPAANRGYRAKGSESLSYSLGVESPPDLFESFNFGSDARVAEPPSRAPITPWPDPVVPGFSAAARRWLAEMERLARFIDDLVDAALGADLASNSLLGPDTAATINYAPGPDGTEPARPGQQRMGAHSDYTSFTILLADPVPGLQIVGPGNEWVDVIPEPGALLVNVGDLLAMMTNDRWPSTLHRVVPMDRGAAARRRSIAYFHYPDHDYVVAPLVGFGEPRYRPVSVEDHLRSKLIAPKVRRRAEGVSTAAGRPVR